MGRECAIVHSFAALPAEVVPTVVAPVHTTRDVRFDTYRLVTPMSTSFSSCAHTMCTVSRWTHNRLHASHNSLHLIAAASFEDRHLTPWTCPVHISCKITATLTSSAMIEGMTRGILITDHNVRETLGICDRAYIVNDGLVFASGHPSEIVQNEAVREVYLGKDFRL